MADVKITALPAAAAVTADDLYAIVDDPAGVPTTQKATHTQALTFFRAQIVATANVFSAAQAIAVADAATNTTTTLATLTHNSSGTPAASFGSRLLFNLDSATVDDRNAFALDVIWTTATDASRSSAMIFNSVSAAGALTEMLRVGPATVTVPAANGITFGSAGSAIISVASSLLRLQGTSGIGVAFFGDNVERVRLLSSGEFGIGTTTAAALLDVVAATTTTNAVKEVARLQARVSTGATGGANGFGASLTFFGESATDGTQRQMGDISTSYIDATDVSRKSLIDFNVWDTAARKAISIEASGSAAKIGVLGAAAVVRQTGGENLTNSVTSGGVDGTIANFTDLTIYANDAAAIRNNIYQLARALKQDHDALRLYGFLT